MPKKNSGLVGPGKEFFSEWHLEEYQAGLEREAEGYKRRMQELKDLGTDPKDKAYTDAESGLKGTLAEIRRLGPESKTAAKRPKTAKESR